MAESERTGQCHVTLCPISDTQVLALRANDYNVQSTIAWKRHEIEAGGGEQVLCCESISPALLKIDSLIVLI